MKDIDQAVPDAAAFDRVLVAGLQRAVKHVVWATVLKARYEHRWQDRTGATRESVKGSVRDNKRGAKGKITAGENAARLNAGTKPHTITAVNAQYLRFQIGSTVFFRRSVNHPGTAPDPFLDAADDAAGEELAMAVEAAMDAALGG